MTDETQWARRLALFGARTFGPQLTDQVLPAAKRGAAGLAEVLPVLSAPTLDRRLAALVTIDRLHLQGWATTASVEALTAHAALQPSLNEELRRALVAIGRARVPALNAGFLRLLTDPHPIRVAGAAYALGGARNHDAIAPLIVVTAHRQTTVRHAGLWALGEIGAATALPILHQRLICGRDVAAVTGALGRIGSSRSLEPLARCIHHPAPAARFLAAATLVRIGVHNHATLSSNGDGAPRPVPAHLGRALQQASEVEPDPRTAMLLLITLALLAMPIDEGQAKLTYQRWREQRPPNQRSASSSSSNAAATASSPALSAACTRVTFDQTSVGTISPRSTRPTSRVCTRNSCS